MPNINFHNVDCMGFMANVPDKFYKLAIVDPPYGIDKDGHRENNRSKLAKSKKYHKALWDQSMPTCEYFRELERISYNQIIWGGNHLAHLICRKSPCWLVWDKDNTGNFADCELAYTSFDTAVRKFKWTWNGMLQQNMKNKQERIHPTEKPIELYRWLLQNYAKPGDNILDTHGGSMSIAIACDMEGYDLDICEIDREYFDAGIKRFQEYKRQLTLF